MKHETLDQIAEWRPKSRWGRRFFATYLKWVVRLGYAFVAVGLGALALSFVIQVDQTIATDAGDPGWVRGLKVDVPAPGPYQSYRLLAKPHSLIKKGDRVAEVTLEDGRTEVLTAAADGVLEPDLDASGRGGWAGRPLARIMDYSSLVVEANLKGETVSRGAIGLEARVLAVDGDRDASVLVAGTVGGEPMASRRILGDEAKGALGAVFLGEEVKAERERGFRVESIERVEVEVQARGRGDGVPPFDPSRSEVILGEVQAGRHWGKVQISAHDRETKAILEDLLKNRLDEVSVLGAVVQAAVTSPALPLGVSPKATGLEASMVDRRFEAVIALPSPPEWLTQLVKDMAKKGKKVRARVEVVTGQTPAALKLLKRS
jgi:hypothetical protein